MNNDEHQQDYVDSRKAIIGADRMALGLGSIPDKTYGDVKAYCRLAHLTLSVWSDLIRLKDATHEGYHSCLQMGGEERKELVDLVLKTEAILTYAFATK